MAREVGGDHGEGVGVHDRPDLGPQLQNDVLTHAYGDIFLMGGAASIAGMLLAFFLPARTRGEPRRERNDELRALREERRRLREERVRPAGTTIRPDLALAHRVRPL